MKLSNTNQRRIIIEELQKLTSHPTAEELYRIVRQRLPQISLGTVYRNLEVLSEAGEILKLEIAGRQKRFDGNTSRHLHMRCSNCGGVSDVHEEEVHQISKFLDSLIDKLGFENYCLEFRGQCHNCKN
jgi:Fur family ferric uptake transcriptional regulator